MWPRGRSSFLRMGAQSRKVRNQPRGAADGKSVHGRAFSIAVRLLAGETLALGDEHGRRWRASAQAVMVNKWSTWPILATKREH